MENNKTYYESLRSFLASYFSRYAHNSTSELVKKELFYKNHMRPSSLRKSEKEINEIAHRRAKQWISDLRTVKRTPKNLTIDDLQIAHEISEYPLDVLLRGQIYWDEGIEYINKALARFIEENCNEINFSNGTYYPIAYHPKTCTLLVAIRFPNKNNIKKSLDSLVQQDFEVYPLQYTVIRISDVTDHIYAAYTIGKDVPAYKPKIHHSYYEAMKAYKSECKCEDGDYTASHKPFLKNLADMYRRLKEYLWEKTDFTEITRYQKLFYGYHSVLLSEDEKKYERKKWSLDDQLNQVMTPARKRRKKVNV